MKHIKFCLIQKNDRIMIETVLRRWVLIWVAFQVQALVPLMIFSVIYLGPLAELDVVEDGVEGNFPQPFRTRETADLFLSLIVKLLRPGGRAGMVHHHHLAQVGISRVGPV